MHIESDSLFSQAGDTEFLRLDKPDFDLVLRRSYQQEWDTRMSALRSLAAFGHWSEEELSATNDRAKLEEFVPNTVNTINCIRNYYN